MLRPLYFYNLSAFTSRLELHMYTAAAEVGVYLDSCILSALGVADCKSMHKMHKLHIFSPLLHHPPPLPPPGLVTVTGHTAARNDKQGLDKAWWIT